MRSPPKLKANQPFEVCFPFLEAILGLLTQLTGVCLWKSCHHGVRVLLVVVSRMLLCYGVLGEVCLSSKWLLVFCYTFAGTIVKTLLE